MPTLSRIQAFALPVALAAVVASPTVAGYCARVVVAVGLVWLGLVSVETALVIANPYS